MPLPVATSGEPSAAALPTTNPLTRKLSLYAQLSDTDRDLLDAILVPGEYFPRDVDIGTITPVRIAPISRVDILDLFVQRPRISAALWWSSLQEEAMLRERIVSFGRRDGRGRVAYILCELLRRHAAIELTDGNVFHLPLTQTELADTLGLTPVHVNVILKDFRNRRIIAIENRMLNILDFANLQAIADYNSDYPHLIGVTSEVSRYFDDLDRTRRDRGGSAETRR